MIRSTKKEVKEKIRNYILDCMDFSDYIGCDGYPDKEPERINDRVLFCYNIFLSEYGYNIRRIGEYRAFQDWLCGIPSALTIDYSYYDSREILKNWLDQTQEESEKYNDYQVWEKFLHLITREFFSMLDMANKERNGVE